MHVTFAELAWTNPSRHWQAPTQLCSFVEQRGWSSVQVYGHRVPHATYSLFGGQISCVGRLQAIDGAGGCGICSASNISKVVGSVVVRRLLQIPSVGSQVYPFGHWSVEHLSVINRRKIAGGRNCRQTPMC